MSRELNRMRKKTIEQLDKAEKQAKDSLESLDCHIEEIQRDTERVAEIAHNAPAVIQNIEKDFKEKTKLEDKDIIFLFICAGLQTCRQFVLPKIFSSQWENSKRLTASEGDKLIEKTVGRVIPKDWHEILFASVPYDATDLVDTFKAKAVLSNAFNIGNVQPGLGGGNHRYLTLGHDPILGWIFGTTNILTGALTKSNFISCYAVEDMKIKDFYPAGTIGMLRDSIRSVYKELHADRETGC